MANPPTRDFITQEQICLKTANKLSTLQTQDYEMMLTTQNPYDSSNILTFLVTILIVPPLYTKHTEHPRPSETFLEFWEVFFF